MNPTVTIVVPSYQQARFLRATIDSILEQDYEPLEVLVMDGGSTDGSPEILASYGDRIRWVSRKDRGQCHAINEGFRRARGDIVAWLNSDDVYRPGAIREAVRVLEEHPEAALVYGEGELIADDGSVMWRFPETCPFDLWRLTNVADYILQPTVFFRRAALFADGVLAAPRAEPVGAQPLDEQLNWGLDWDLWIRLGRRFPFAYTDRVLAGARMHGEQKTATGGWRRLGELRRILRQHGAGPFSPASVAHTLITAVRQVAPEERPVDAEFVASAVPGPLRRLVQPVVATAEKRMRRWLQNAQGVWPDGYVGAVGHLWLPHDGRAGTVVARVRNLERADQIVCLHGPDGGCTRTPPLAPGATAELHLDVPAGQVPLKLRMTCARVLRVEPLDPRLGKRRAGFVLEATEFVDAETAPAARRPEPQNGREASGTST